MYDSHDVSDLNLRSHWNCTFGTIFILFKIWNIENFDLPIEGNSGSDWGFLKNFNPYLLMFIFKKN